MIERTNNRLPLKTQAELLSVSRSSLYYRPKAPSAQEVQAKQRIDEIYTAHPFLGSRKITVLLRKEMRISRPTVQRYMREMGITVIYPAPRLSQPHPEHKIYPYLLRNLVIERPNQVWGLDITFIRLRGGWLYLVAVLDWFSRFVVSWVLAWLIFYMRYSKRVYRDLGYEGPLLIRTGLDRVRGRQFRIPLDETGNTFEEGRPRLDDTVSVERVFQVQDLSTGLLRISKDLFRALTFACGWSKAYTAPEDFIEWNIDRALGYLMWSRSDVDQ
ncbi:MAG: IS3 family transposase [Anaerolineales bacterium]|nr:IS3 family transposase [Anaerolineales bacterium]